MDNEAWIYESPDGGHTVYRRQLNKLNRELFSIDDETQARLDRFREDKLWIEIRQQSQTDTVLKTMLDQIEIYYRMKYNEKS